ncbi:hypothetical protein AURDEDRAFT_166127 [Auricularia subglabra TFB-10046 SS5]|nr:hypothetical protein AURDEDRAFT_166127 [Auricularia subglabra TFB-10046 SS5]
MRVGLAVVVLALVRAGARAQNTTAQCLGEFYWAFNNLSQSPCLVAAYLLAPCSPGGGRVSALTAPGLTYNPPAPDTALVANEWSYWSANCGDSQKTIGSYPLAVNDTRLPQWLFQDVVKTDTFDVITAEQVAASALPDQEGGIPPAATPTSPVKPVGKSSKAVPLAEIIAGVVGGIATLLIFAILGTCLWRRRKQKKGDQEEQGTRQHSRGKSLEDIVISKPLPPDPAPNTGSSFGPPGPAPWPTSSDTGKAASGWPQGPATPRGANPIPVSLTVQSPGGERRIRIQEGNDMVFSPSVSAPRSETGSARQLALQTAPPRTTSPRLVAGPVPQAPFDPEDPRTWPPTHPPPRKLQIKMQGLPATPRQKRAVRVNSRDDGQARYPTPQLGGRLELEAQPQIGLATRYPGPTVVIPPRSAASHSPSSSQSGRRLCGWRAPRAVTIFEPDQQDGPLADGSSSDLSTIRSELIRPLSVVSHSAVAFVAQGPNAAFPGFQPESEQVRALAQPESEWTEEIRTFSDIEYVECRYTALQESE